MEAAAVCMAVNEVMATPAIRTTAFVVVIDDPFLS
jgi:hypothetical protein